jgi:hypothetical protein
MQEVRDDSCGHKFINNKNNKKNCQKFLKVDSDAKKLE